MRAVYKHDLTGRTFGLWSVREQASNTQAGRTLWRCLCECGQEKPVRTEHLVRGVSTNCGCRRVKKAAESNRKRPYEAIYNALVRQAREYSRSLTLSYEEFVPLTSAHACSYCGEPLEWSMYSPQKGCGMKHQLDRKDNNLGYTLDNVAVCCTSCNYAKGSRYTHEEWVCMTVALKEFRDGRKRIASSTRTAHC